jgi:hypothetical protein
VRLARWDDPQVDAPEWSATIGTLHVTPNPFARETEIRYSLATGGVGTIRVYDVQGRFVRSLAARGGTAGGASWDGRDGSGRRVPAGVYFVRLDSSEGTVSTRVTLRP